MSALVSETGEIKEIIVQVCSDHWQDSGRALLLSQLGVTLGRDKKLDLTTALNGRKLLQFIRDELGNDLRVVEDPSNKGIWGLVPKNNELSNDLRPYFERKKQRAYSDKSRGPRFDRRLWMSFTKPLDKGRTRLIKLGSEVTFLDVDEKTGDVSDALQIGTDWIVARTNEFDPDRYQKIRAQIENWASENKIDIFRLLQRSRQKVSNQPISKGAAISGDTALHTLLGLIESDDLRRISAPLDVVARLLRKGKPPDS